MPYLTVTLEVPHALADSLGDALLDAGALSVELTDALQGTDREMPIFAEPGADSRLWALCRVRVLLGADLDAASLILRASEACRLPAFDFSVERLEDADWVSLSRAQFQPIRISEALWIVPSWHEIPDVCALAIRLDPGAAFGTGSHPTTRLCLQWLEERRHELAGKQILDYGCGSGILGIAALKLGAASAVGIDIDEHALLAAQQNAEANGVPMEFQSAERGFAGTADVVLANILANPLRALAPLLARHTKPGGHLALAGLLDSQAHDLLAIYDEWYEMVAWRQAEGWTCLTGIRRS
jgi:ribosomal protein L11 methyltransferase